MQTGLGRLILVFLLLAGISGRGVAAPCSQLKDGVHHSGSEDELEYVSVARTEVVFSDQSAVEFAEDYARLAAIGGLLAAVPKDWLMADGTLKGVMGLETCQSGKVVVAQARISKKTVEAAMQLSVLMGQDSPKPTSPTPAPAPAQEEVQEEPPP